jgi:micrococcal nuclease
MLTLASAALALALALVVGATVVARTGVDAGPALVVAAVLLAGTGTVAQVAPVGVDAPATDALAARPVASGAADADAVPGTSATADVTTGADAADGGTNATVVGVVSGDRLTYRTAAGDRRTVGLAGVDAPGLDGADPTRFEGVLTGDRGRECLADRGRRALLSLRSYRGETATVRTVETGRAVVRVDGRSLNRRQVERGHARATDGRYADAERAARSADRGVWACGVVTPSRPLRAANERSVYVAAIHPNPPGADEASLAEERIVLANDGRATVDLSNWYLVDGDGRTYFFFDGRHLRPGERLVLHVGAGTGRDGHVYWGAAVPVLDNDHETLKLVDGDSDRVIRVSY